jgi:uncharacterized protein YbaR (Trm112 family)
MQDKKATYAIRPPTALGLANGWAFALQCRSRKDSDKSGSGFGERTMAISQELLEILACPKCKGDLELNATQDGLVCKSCKLLYRIEDDIPIMLIVEAQKVE